MLRNLISLTLVCAGAAAQTHFHHLHLRVRDPEAAIAFYTSRFDCERRLFAGKPAVWTGSTWLLLEKAGRAPAAAVESAIWHFGWGAEDMKKAYAEQLAKGTKFDTPLTDISDLARRPGFFYAYVRGPEGALIELNTANHHRFGHLHLLSADPIGAGEWWAKYFGVPRPAGGRAARFYKGFQVGPSVSFVLDGVNVIIFPVEYVQPPVRLVSTRGRVVDHVGLRVADLDGLLRRMKAGGVRVIAGPRKRGGMRTAMVEGPDLLAIELLEELR